jgi:hypothetical protein
LSGEGGSVDRRAVLPDLVPVETVTASAPITFPYVPGLLAFREMPLVLAALNKLSALPDLILIDGQEAGTPAPLRHRLLRRGTHRHPLYRRREIDTLRQARTGRRRTG